MYVFPDAGNAQVMRLTLNESIEMAISGSLQSFRTQNMYGKLLGVQIVQGRKASFIKSENNSAAILPRFYKTLRLTQNIDIYREQQSLYSYVNLAITQNLDITGGTFYRL